MDASCAISESELILKQIKTLEEEIASLGSYGIDKNSKTDLVKIKSELYSDFSRARENIKYYLDTEIENIKSIYQFGLICRPQKCAKAIQQLQKFKTISKMGFPEYGSQALELINAGLKERLKNWLEMKKLVIEEVCVICLDSVSVYGFQNCRHVPMCKNCAIKSREMDSKECPVCRTKGKMVNYGELINLTKS